jgi:DNA topoisomerase-2
MEGQEQEPMMPWWRGFEGTVKKVGDNKYDVFGLAKKIDDTTIEVTELPIHKWTSNFKAELENLIAGEKSEGLVKVSVQALKYRDQA